MTIRIISISGDELSPNATILYEYKFPTHLNIRESTQYTQPVTMITATKFKVGRTDRDETTPLSLNLGIGRNENLHNYIIALP